MSTSRQRRQLVFWGVAAATAAAAAAIQFWRLGAVPEGLHVDEAAVGWNAWCIARTLADERGIALPVFFYTIFQYTDPGMIYLAAPVLAITGPTVAALRACAGIWHLLAAAAVGGLVYEYRRQRWWALAGAALFFLLPHAFVPGRAPMSAHMPYVFGVAFGWWWLHRAFRRRSMTAAALAAAGWALTIYSNHVARPMAFVYLVTFAAVYGRLLWRRRLVGLVFCLVLLVLIVPMCVTLLEDSQPLTMRMGGVNVWQHAHGPLGAFGQLVRRYLDYFGPHFLLFAGDAIPRHHSQFGGVLFIGMLPLIVGFGILFVHGGWRRVEYRCVVAGVLVSPLAAALCFERYHATRTIAGGVFWVLVAVLGAAWLWRRKRGLGRAVVLVSAAFILVQSGFYLHHYFTAYPVLARLYFDAPLNWALETARQEAAPDELIQVSDSISHIHLNEKLMPAIYVTALYRLRIDPATYQERGLPPERVRLYDSTQPAPGILVRCSHTWQPADGRLRIRANREPVPPEAQLLASRDLHPYTLNEHAWWEGTAGVAVEPRTGWPRMEVWRLPAAGAVP